MLANKKCKYSARHKKIEKYKQKQQKEKSKKIGSQGMPRRTFLLKARPAEWRRMCVQNVFPRISLKFDVSPMRERKIERVSESPTHQEVRRNRMQTCARTDIKPIIPMCTLAFAAKFVYAYGMECVVDDSNSCRRSQKAACSRRGIVTSAHATVAASLQ